MAGLLSGCFSVLLLTHLYTRVKVSMCMKLFPKLYSELVKGLELTWLLSSLAQCGNLLDFMKVSPQIVIIDSWTPHPPYLYFPPCLAVIADKRSLSTIMTS